MQSTGEGIKNNRSYQLKRIVFIGFLVLSPVLPYGITIAYNSFLFARTKAETHALPAYPGANLVESDIYQDYSSNRCLDWRFRYTTTASPEEIGDFYESAFLNSGWHRSGGFDGLERYAKSTTNVLVVSSSAGKFTVSVTADVFPIFEPGCSP